VLATLQIHIATLQIHIEGIATLQIHIEGASHSADPLDSGVFFSSQDTLQISGECPDTVQSI
jgi:hypothetical protein